MSGPRIVRGAYWALPLDWLRPPCPQGPYVIEEAYWPDAEQLAGAIGVSCDVVGDRFSRGARAWVAWYLPAPDGAREEVAAWLWTATGRHRDEPVRRDLFLAPDEAYGWGAGTLPEHRGCGLFPALLVTAGAELGREGHRLMWGGIHDGNLASRQACVRAGYRPVLRVSALLAGHHSLIHGRPVDYADPDLVRRARRMLGTQLP